MKKLILLLVVLLPAAALAESLAAPWGFMYDVEDTNKNLQPYLMENLISGEPITFCIDGVFSEENDTPEIRAALHKNTAQDIQDGYDYWVKSVKKIIEESGRAQEFKAIMPMLSRPVNMKEVECRTVFEDFYKKYYKGLRGWVDDNQAVIAENAPEEKTIIKKLKKAMSRQNHDITFIINDEHIDVPLSDGRTTAAFFTRGGDWPSFIFWTRALISPRTLAHEIGHSLGFKDQYEAAREITSHPVYTTGSEEESIMNNESVGITCDDADGFINFWDFTRGAGKCSLGGEDGWVSLCPSKLYRYKKCVPQKIEEQQQQKQELKYAVKQEVSKLQKGKMKR